MPLLRRSSGLLLHPTSLPSSSGIGEIGPQAHQWIHLLAEHGQQLWQMLPLGPTGYGNSPYQCLSSFAGNPLLISLESLLRDGFLDPSELACYPRFSDQVVEFEALSEVKQAILKQAASKFLVQKSYSPSIERAFEAFCEREAAWLDDYAMFIAIKAAHDGLPWNAWPQNLAQRQPEAMAEVMAGLDAEIEEVKIIQFFFSIQWARLREVARECGVRLIGDIPIFTAHDSADVWANPNLFELDVHGSPTVVAGVPPDYFSATGQRWGNPLYRWSQHRETNYAWWTQRLQQTLQQVDIVRIDHFRGFAAYWEIPAHEETAIRGRWVAAPGLDLFRSLSANLGMEHLPVIAEDLGIITPDVVELREACGYPGMKVLQFAFGADSLAHEYLPENYPVNSVAYTGTHDNDTTLGLFRSEAGENTTRTPEMVEAERRTILGYTQTDGSELNWDFIRLVWNSASNLAIAPLQDVLGLGSESRMNVPGQVGGNWSWRFSWDQLEPSFLDRLRAITQSSGR